MWHEGKILEADYDSIFQYMPNMQINCEKEGYAIALLEDNKILSLGEFVRCVLG